MLRPSQFQLNAESAADPEKTFKLKPSQLTVTSPTSSASSTASPPNPSGNNTTTTTTSNNSTTTTTKESDGESSNSNSGPLFANPFMRGFSRDEDSSSAKVDAKEPSVQEKKDENFDPLAKLGGGASASSTALPKSNLFNVKQATLSSGAGFVFGQNIGERVTGQSTNLFGDAVATKDAEEKNNEEKDATEKEKNCNGAGSSGAGGGGGLFFSNVATNSSKSDAMETKEVDGKSLLEATREWEEKSKVQKRKYEEVETITGEEDERNIVEINGKIFAFEDRNYEERGRGTLRLNDSKVKQNESRVVFRTSGNLRVLINTKVWSKMIVEKPSTKSLRMTAIDSEGHIKVFLVQARPDDITQLYKYLKERVNKLIALDRELEQKSDEEPAENPPLDEKTADEEDIDDELTETARSTTPTKYPAQTICIKINDQETSDETCNKKRRVREH